MKQPIKKLTLAIALSSALLLSAQQASASAIQLQFDDISDQGGTISYDGSTNGVLVGSNIIFDTITAVNTPSNVSEVLSITNGRLNFTTGEIASTGTNFWSFAPGGTFTLTGGVEDSSGAMIVPAGSTLVSGSFTNNSFVIGDELELNFGGAGEDSKHPSLLSFYGIDENADFTFVNTELALRDISIIGDGFSGIVTDSDLTNSTTDTGGSSVPSNINMFSMLCIVFSSFAFIRNQFLSDNKNSQLN